MGRKLDRAWAEPDAWPVDFNNDQTATTQDVLKYIPGLNTSPPNPAYNVRFDLDGDNKLTTQDVMKFIVPEPDVHSIAAEN